MSVRRGVALAFLLTGASAQAQQDAAIDYAEGQVWEYRARPQDAGSVLKIQQIEQARGGAIYHISLSALCVGGGSEPVTLPHAPVSREALDASVITLAPPGAFPETDFADGIAQWRAASGGVFTIAAGRIADAVEQAAGTGCGR